MRYPLFIILFFGLLYLAVQVGIILGLYFKVLDSDAYMSYRRYWSFRRRLPTDPEFWDDMIFSKGVRAVAFDLERTLAPRGSRQRYPGVDGMLAYLLEHKVGVFITTNTGRTGLEQMFDSRVQIIQPAPQPHQGLRRLVAPLLRYFSKKPFEGYWRPALARIMGAPENILAAGEVLVVDDKIESLICPLAQGTRVLTIHPMPGTDSRGDKFWALRVRERLVAVSMGVRRPWLDAL